MLQYSYFLTEDLCNPKTFATFAGDNEKLMAEDAGQDIDVNVGETIVNKKVQKTYNQRLL